MMRGASIRARLRGPVALRRPGLAAATAALLAAGCGTVAWHGTPAVPGECVLAAPVQVDSLAAAVKATTATAEASGPRREIFGGASLLALGDKMVGLDSYTSSGPPYVPDGSPIHWGTMFDRGFGIDVQVVLRRPQRAATSLATGDTMLVVRGTIETYPGKEYWLGTGYATPDDLTIMGGWVEGRTLLNALDAGRTLRPYIQYGGGVMRYGELAVGSLSWWDATMALGWRTALGLELRAGRVGLYVEGGIQVVGPPDVPPYYLEQISTQPGGVAARSAQDMVTYPIRFGAMIGF